MKRLKMILNSNIFIFILVIFCLIYFIINTTIERKSIYNGNETSFYFTITDFNISDDKVSFSFKGDEDLVGTYSFKGDEDLVGTYYFKDDYDYYLNNLKYGLKVKVHGSLQMPSNNMIPHAFNYKKYLSNKDIYYILKIDKMELEDENINFLYKFKNIIYQRINKIDEKGYLKAFILGDKDYIDDDAYSNLSSIGVTHLFALSGMHIGLLSFILFKMMRFKNEYLKYIIVNVLLIMYGYIVLFPSSIKRCILFFILNSINKLFDFRISQIKILIMVACLLIFSNYKIVYDIGFLYSIVTVFSILYFNDFIASDNKIFSSFKLSMVAFLFSLPISLCNFYNVNLLSVIYNIFYVPYVSIIVYPLSLLTMVFRPFVYLFNISINILEYVSSLLCKIDIFVLYTHFNFIEVIIYYLLVFLSLFKRNLLIFCIAIVFMTIHFIMPYFDGNAYVYYFDVGQGDSSLVITPFRKDIILIDTGGIVGFDNKDSIYKVSDNVITFLKYLGIKRISNLIITHGDFDHMGEIDNYLNNTNIDNIILNVGTFNSLEQDLKNKLDNMNIKYRNNVDFLNIYKGKIYFLNTKIYDNENDNSNVLFFSLYNNSFLYMGDASTFREKDIIAKYNLKEKIDFLKVGHHGSNTSSSIDFINSIKPLNCMISVGKKNRYGHPKMEVLDILDDYCDIYRTDLDGSIEIILNKNKHEIITYSP